MTLKISTSHNLKYVLLHYYMTVFHILGRN